jgi:hypothetical protein
MKSNRNQNGLVRGWAGVVCGPLLVAAMLLMTLVTPLAHAQQKPDGPGMGEPKADAPIPQQELTPAQIEAFSRAWTNDAEPTITLTVLTLQNGQLTQPQTDLSEAMKNALSDMLGRSDAKVSNWNFAGAVREQRLDVVRDREGDRVAETVGKLVQQRADADLVFLVTLVPSGGRANVYLKVLDTRTPNLDEIASDQLTEIPLSPAGFEGDWQQRVRQFAYELCTKFIDGYGRYGARGKVFSLLLVDGVPNAEVLDDLAGSLKRAEGVSGVKSEMQDRGGGRIAAEYSLRFKGAPEDLRRALRKTIKDHFEGKKKLQFFDAGSSQRLSAVLEDAIVPAWWTLTDAKSDTFDASREYRTRIVDSSGLAPNVAVVVGAPMNEPVSTLFEGVKVAMPAMRFDEGELADALGVAFRDYAGFEPLDRGELQAQLQQAQTQSQKFENDAQLMTALAAKKQFRFLVDVRRDTNTNRLSIRLIDRADATLVGSVAWPDQRARDATEYQIREDRVEEVSRYVVGTLLERIDAKYRNQARRLSVTITNIPADKGDQQLVAFARAFESIPQVKSVVNRRLETPAAFFDVAFSGSLDQLIVELQKRVEQLDAKAAITSLRDQEMVINLLPKFAPIASSKDPKASQAESANLQQAVNKISPSVWIPAIELQDGRILNTGTAWTVAQGKLATNCHVVDAMVELRDTAQAKGVFKRLVVLGGKNGSIKLVVRAMTKHPGYDAANSILGGLVAVPIFDVALIEVDGDAGAPIPIANDQTLSALQPGDALGYCGFASENLNGGADGLPVRRVDVGTLSAATDIFFREPQSMGLRILHTDLKAAGGASGSPIINAKGEAIALLSAGDVLLGATQSGVQRGADGTAQPVIAMKRIPVGFTYGQQVDMLRELLDGSAPSKQAQRTQAWTELAARLRAGG